jgi:tetratricopeptide (TPR) repeat protein
MAAGLCSALCATAVPQKGEGGWRGLLLSKATAAMNGAGSAEQTHQAVMDAIRSIDGLTSTENDVPDHVRTLADSIAMVLHAFEASAYLREELPNNAALAYRAAIERAQRDPLLAHPYQDLVDALASAQRAAGEGASARATYDDALKKAGAARDTTALRRFLVQKALLCTELNEYKEAIDLNLRILDIDKRSGDAMNEIGTELRLSGAYEKINGKEAFAHATNAYKLAERTDQGRSLLSACDLLIRSFHITADFDQCKTMLDRAMALANERNVGTERARIHDRFGRFYMRKEKFDEAAKHLQQGLDALGHKVPSEDPVTGNAQADVYLAELLLDLGQCYRAQGDTAKALMYLDECERLLNADTAVPISPWADLGELYLLKGFVARAAEYGHRALKFAETEKNKELERRATDLLYRVYKKQGNTKDALEMHERLMAASSTDEDRYKLELQRTQMTMTFSEKQLTDSVAAARVAEALRSDNKIGETRRRYLVYGGIALFLAAAIVALFDRKRRMARFDREAAQLETQALRSQMNPHFIFNALNSINAFVQKNEPDKAAAFLARFARLMRLVLENSRQTEVPLKDDLEALDAYLHLERARTGDKFDYRIQVASDIDPEDVMVPPLVAQPFVENAIWHGIAGKEEKGMITLSVSRKGDQLLFAIEDDGVGRSSPKRMASMGESDPHDAPAKRTSLGTAITKARLDLVRQQKGKAAGFIYVDLPQGTRVELTLPFSTAA